jgi:uncharacterized protein (TIGR02271 family)
MQSVVGLYERIEDAQRALQDLRKAGFRSEDISLITRDRDGEYSRGLKGGERQHDTDVTDGAAAGAGIGAVLGGLGGLLVGLGALAIPGIGPVIAAGPIVSALAGAGIGAVAGGLVGALVDLGIPEDHAKIYAEGVEHGNTLVVVRTDAAQANRASDIMNRHNPVDIENRGTMREQRRDTMPVTGTDQRDFDRTRTDQRDFDRTRNDKDIPVTGDTTIPIVEEQMRVGKREVEKGGVHVEKHTRETPVEEDVNLREEHINVERRPVDRDATEADFNAFKEGSMDLTERSEEAVVDKRARVTEEVHIDKDVHERTEKVQDTLRHDEVEVTKTGGRQRTGVDYREFDNDFRQHHRSKYGTTGRDYNTYQPAYRYGYDLANDNRYSSYDWNRLEPEARRDWERRGGQSAWDDVKDAVRHAWERVRR